MFYPSSLYKKILETSATIIVILMMALYPAPIVFAETTPPPEEPPVEEVVEEPQTQQEETLEEPVQQEGGDGQDGQDAGDGNDGGDGGVEPEPEEPQPGQDGGDTGDAGDGGDGGDTGGVDESANGDEETTIDTGNATSQGGIDNYVDVNILRTLAEQAGIELPPLVLSYIYWDSESGTYKGSTPEAQAKLDIALEDGIVDPYEYLDIITPEEDTIASTTNDAVVENLADVEAETGANTANNNHDVSISTGDAKAVANVLNVVNTNIFDSEGFFLFLDNLTEDGVNGNLDFRDFEFFNPEAVQETSNARVDTSDNPITAICPTCGGAGDLTINTDQNAEITNDIVVRSGTGANDALYNSGNVSIDTGDAYAAANAINLANTNIVDSNYLLLTFNNFGDYNSDIVFPSANEFLELFETGGQTTPESVNVDNNNTTGVDNNTDVVGDTGENTAHETSDGGSIATGDASAHSNTLNQINSNLFGGSSFSILVKVHGEWNGDVIGIPDDMTWRETAEGIELIYDSEATQCAEGGCNSYDAINVTNNNSTQITNNISVMALTGDNKIEGAGGDASITTGDAYAAANTINVANTNVIGKNWMMAVVNIFGDWNGDITFGQPNLWVGAKANIPANASEGTEFTYEYTVMNTGDAPSTNVCLRNRFDHRLLDLKITNPAQDRQIAAGHVEYCIGTINPGEVRETTRRAQIGSVPYGSTFLSNEIEVIGGGDDPFLEDNTEVVTFDIFKQPPYASVSGTKVIYTPSPELTISKVNAAPFWVRASSTVDYRIIVQNNGAGSAYNAVLIDTLYNEAGEKQYEEYWDLGEIYAGEEIEIMYTTFYNEATEPGLYRNVARIEALGGYHTWTYGHDASTEEVESTIKIVPPIERPKAPEVIEIIEESKEVTEDLSEVIEEDETVVEPVEPVDPVEPLVVATLPSNAFEPQYGPFHGPFYYERTGEHVDGFNALFAGQFFDHPRFTGHPVHIASQDPFVDHPKFTGHPVYWQHSYMHGGQNVYGDDLIGSDFTAGPGFIKFLSIPFGDLSYAPSQNRDDDESDKVLALLALSMFVLRNPRAGRKND